MDLTVGLVAAKKGKNLAMWLIEPQFYDCPARNVVIILTALSWILYVMLMAFVNRVFE